MNNATERWLPIPVSGYEGFYEASNLGRVRSTPRKAANGSVGRILKPYQTPDVHLMVALSVNGKSKSFLVHRLIAITFIGPPPPGLEVCHQDGDGLNNVLDNLRWGTRSDNVRDAIRHGTNTWISRTHCPQGHPYDTENTSIGRRGNGRTFRVCRICSREAKRRYEERRRSRS